MANILEIILKAVAQGSGFKSTQKDVADLDKALGGLNKILGVAGLAVGAKELFDFGKASVDAALESATAEAALQTALNSTGQATAEYKAQLDALATSLENTTMFTDEQVMAAEASLVTFRNIGQNVMPQVITTVADMGQKMGDMGAAAQLAGIALNAPEQAAARLQRQGIMLSQQQRDQIAAFVEMGNTAGAQGIILDALNTKYGGQAVAARDAAGGMQDWSVAVSRLQEEFGKLLLAIGTEAGVGGAATGLVNTLTEGSTVWAANVEQIGLFVDALNRANAELNNTSAASADAANEVGYIQQIQKGWEIILLSTANAAIESTVGWDALAESYGTIQVEAAQAEQATREANQAIAETPLATGASAQALDTLAARWQGLANAQRTMSGGRDALETMAGGSTFSADEAVAFAEQQKEKEQAAKQTAQSITKAFDEVGQEISSSISSAVSGAVSEAGNWVQKALGIDEEGAARVEEDVRRMAAVATGGLANEWTQQLATQLKGVDAAQAFVNAVAGGDNAAVMEEARKLAINPIVELFDVMAMANGIEQKLRGEDLSGQLNQRIQKILSEKGLDTSIDAISQVAQGTQAVATTAGTSVDNIGVSSEAAGERVKTAFAGTLPAIDTLSARMSLLIGLIERVGVVAQASAGQVAGLNPPEVGTGAGLVPNGAQRRMGGMTPQ